MLKRIMDRVTDRHAQEILRIIQGIGMGEKTYIELDDRLAHLQQEEYEALKTEGSSCGKKD